MSTVWPDPSWHITTSQADLCDVGGEEDLEVSTYSRSGSAFTCGTTAQSLLACTKDSNGIALCLTDYASRQAVRFPTKARPPRNGAERPQPLSVRLTNGLVCSAVAQDPTPHYDNRHSWLSCGLDGALLLPPGKGAQDSDQYFTKAGRSWTAQLSTGTSPPQTVQVAQVIYAT